jgi:hypothetical protein
VRPRFCERVAESHPRHRCFERHGDDRTGPLRAQAALAVRSFVAASSGIPSNQGRP